MKPLLTKLIESLTVAAVLGIIGYVWKLVETLHEYEMQLQRLSMELDWLKAALGG